MIHHRAEPDVWPLYELSFGKRPRRAHDLRGPRLHAKLATDPAYDAIR
ncbi:MAG: hypothetical protein R2867_38780 [Caldilineaceae bacterium]